MLTQWKPKGIHIVLNNVHSPLKRPTRASAGRGLSLVELMIGIAVGSLIVGGAATLFVNNILASRRMLLEARINQDLRAVGDLITRDLRRAGYWDNAIQGTVLSGTNTAPQSNPYRTVSYDSISNELTYSFSRGTENDTLDSAENFGFRLNSGVIQMKTSSSAWQDVTDPNVITVTQLKIVPTTNTVWLGARCTPVLSPGSANSSGGAGPSLTMRSFDVTIEAKSANDTTSATTRQLHTSVKVRNDLFSGSC